MLHGGTTVSHHESLWFKHQPISRVSIHNLLEQLAGFLPGSPGQGQSEDLQLQPPGAAKSQLADGLLDHEPTLDILR